MEIRGTKLSELPALLGLYAQAREFMKENGNPSQWGSSYPEEEIVERDIRSGCSYVCEEDGIILGTFFFQAAPEPDYVRIYGGEWLDDAPYGVVHRIAANSRRKGVASFCLDWAFGQCGNLRMDTHRDNLPMQRLLEKKGFVRCGIIYIRDGSERIGFQKIQ